MNQYKSPQWHRTPKARARAAYSNMIRRCHGGSASEDAYQNVEVRMTKSEWLAWAIPQYTAFMLANPDVVPHAARKGDLGHYEVGNIDIISARENMLSQSDRFKLTLNPDGTKICQRCRHVLTAGDFHKNASRPDGLGTDCKACVYIYRRNYRLKLSHKSTARLPSF